MHWFAGIFASLQAGDICHCWDQGQAGSHGPACHCLQGGLQLPTARSLPCHALIHCIFYCSCIVILPVLSGLARLVLKTQSSREQEWVEVMSASHCSRRCNKHCEEEEWVESASVSSCSRRCNIHCGKEEWVESASAPHCSRTCNQHCGEEEWVESASASHCSRRCNKRRQHMSSTCPAWPTFHKGLKDSQYRP